MNNNNKILYISHDGILDPLGESQILQYLYKLSKTNNFYLVTLEKKNNLKNISKVKKLLNKTSKFSIRWKYFPFEDNSIILKIINYIHLFKYLFFKLKKNKIKIVHIRSYLPGFYILPLKLFFKFNIIFDIRGFLPEEKIDRLNISHFNYKYMILKVIEKLLFSFSDEIVTLTTQSKNIIKSNYTKSLNNITVIPTCVDTGKFKPVKNINKKLTFGYIGNVYGAYNFYPILNFLKKIIEIDKNVFLDIYTNQNKELINKSFLKNEILEKNYNISSVSRDNLVNIIPYFDFGIFNLKINYSIKASFPTKIAEYLSCGIPIICNNFNEDIENFISNNNIGYILDFEKEIKDIRELYLNLNKLRKNEVIKKDCRSFCINHLSIEKACIEYEKIYKNYL